MTSADSSPTGLSCDAADPPAVGHWSGRGVLWRSAPHSGSVRGDGGWEWDDFLARNWQVSWMGKTCDLKSKQHLAPLKELPSGNDWLTFRGWKLPLIQLSYLLKNGYVPQLRLITRMYKSNIPESILSLLWKGCSFGCLTKTQWLQKQGHSVDIGSSCSVGQMNLKSMVSPDIKLQMW